MKRILTGAAAMRREDRLQQREDRLSDRVLDLRAQIASLTAENERLHQAIVDHIEGHDWSWVDPVSRGYPDVDDLRAALQPKEDK